MLSNEEWESLCKQCGKCCYLWIDNLVRSATEACVLLNLGTKQCMFYEDRFAKKQEVYKGIRRCVPLREKDLKKYYETKFLPDDCGYIQYYLKTLFQ